MTELSGMRIALSALQSQAKALQTVGNNIANAGTDGYSRQRADLVSDAGPTTPAMWSRWSGGGQGTSVAGISRSSDQFVTAQALAAHGQSTFLSGQADVLTGIENAVGEPSDTGLSSSLTDLWAGFSALATNPADTAARSALLQKAGTVAQQFGSVSAQMSSMWQNQRAQLPSLAADLTSSAQGVATLNAQIKAAAAGGLPTADLQDKRDLLVDHMAQVGGVTTVAHDDGSVDVMLGGSAIVSGTSARALTVSGTTDYTAAGAGSVAITWADSGTPASVPGGTAGAVLDAVNNVLPTWRDRIDTVAAQVTSTVNAAHQAGYDLSGTAGGPLFSGTTAATMQVVITDPKKIAASSSATSTLDNGNALDLADLGTSLTGPDAAWRSAVADLGVVSQGAGRRVDVQTALTTQADAAQQSVSGVNLDEEMTSMLEYQRGYEAASKFMSTIDQTIQSILQMVN